MVALLLRKAFVVYLQFKIYIDDIGWLDRLCCKKVVSYDDGLCRARLLQPLQGIYISSSLLQILLAALDIDALGVGSLALTHA